MIEVTGFYMKDDKNKVIPDSFSAHYYCDVCDKNYSSKDTEQVNAAAESHALLHRKRIYTPDLEFIRSGN